jgi:hypothetical protein
MIGTSRFGFACARPSATTLRRHVDHEEGRDARHAPRTFVALSNQWSPAAAIANTETLPCFTPA